MLHKDIVENMTNDEIVELAKSEYGQSFKVSDNFDVKISYDDGGRLLEFYVEGEENAETLRKTLPRRYNDILTIVVYKYEPDYELNDEDPRI